MNEMGNFGRLDEEKGTLRILLILLYNHIPCPKTELIEQLKRAGVGRTAFYSSYEILIELGLIQRVEDAENRKAVLTTLTEKGLRVSEKLLEIQSILDPLEDR